MSKRNLLKILLYITYSFLLAVLLFYYSFPYTKLMKYSLAKHQQEIPLIVKIHEVSPKTLPVSFLISDIRLFGKGNYDNTLLAAFDNVSITPSLWALASGKLPLDLRGGVYGGNLQIRVIGEKPPSPIRVDGTLTSLSLEKWDTPKSLWNLDLAGKIDVEITYSGPLKISNRGKGKATLKVTKGSITGLKKYFSPIDGLDQCTLNAQLEYSDGRLSIEQCKLVSRQGRADIEGDVGVSSDPRKSSLNLLARLTISSSTRQELKLPFKEVKFGVQGSAANPKIKFLGGK